MYQAARSLAQRLTLGFLIASTSILLRADQPPEILHANYPASSIYNSPVYNSELFANASVCDATGNVYVTGSFMGTATFGTNILNSSGGFAFDDVYVVKYDPDGNVLWARRAGGSGKDYGRAITLDGTGGIYVAGTSDSYPSYFGTNVFNLYVQSLFVAHYDVNGNVLWAERGGAPPNPGGKVYVSGITRDANNNLIIGGTFTGNPNFGGNFNGQTGHQTIYLTNHNASLPTAYQDTFLAKFDAGGSLLWAINPGGADDDYANAVAVDSAGAIYTTGGYTKSNTLGGVIYTNSTEGIFLAKFSSIGDLVWSSNLSDATNSNPGHGLALVVDAADRVTLSVQANTSSKPFAYQGTNYSLAFGAINLLAQFDTSGNLAWLKRSALIGGNPTSLTLDRQNNIYLGGNSGLLNGSVPALSLSIVKYDFTGQPVWTNSVPKSPVGITLGLPAVSLDDGGIAHVTTTLTGGEGSWLTVGWTNIYPFTAFGYNQLLFTMASNFVAVSPAFVQQPTNMVYQPPKGLTNSALARAWPASKYYWYMNGTKLAGQTNFFLALGPTGFTNQTTYFAVASNAYGMATSIVVNAQAGISFASAPPTNINVLIGTTLSLSGFGAGTTPVGYQWQFKGTNIANAIGSTLLVPNIATNQSGNYTLVISNATGALTSTPPSTVTVVMPGFVDPSVTNMTTTVRDLLRWPNGYYLASTAVLARDSDTLYIAAAGALPGGIGRYNTNGTPDATFNPGTGPVNTQEGPSFNRINSLIRLANGQYLVAGRFNTFNGVAYTNLVRLNTNGSLDLTFSKHSFLYSSDPVQGPGEVLRIALQNDGKILVGGEFGLFDGSGVSNLVRLHANGTVDGTFSAGDFLKTPPYGRVHAILPLADGKILVGGAWGNGTNAGVARLLTNGVADLTFNCAASTAPTHAIALVNNKLIVGGQNFVKRLTYDGALDPTFMSASTFYWDGTQTEVIIVEPSGNVMVGGSGYGMRRLWLEPSPIVIPSFAGGSGINLVNGQFQLSACGGVDGQNIVVQASTDLINWVNISTNVVIGGCISYTDPQTPPLPSRYYRLTVQP